MAAIIKQRTKIKELRKPFKIPVDVLAELELYAEFLNERKDFIVAEGLRACFKSDSAFKAFLETPEQQKKVTQLRATFTTSKGRRKAAMMPSVA